MATETDRLQLTWQTPPGILGWLSAVNHRSIGMRFIVTAFIFFLIGGIEATVLRWQLAQPANDVISPETYNQLFTMHGSTMMFLFAVPILEGFAMYLLPLMFGARDLPFPRLNAFGYWAFLFGGVFLYVSFFAGAMPDGGWFAYVPLTGPEYSPGINMDYWLLGITLVEVSAIVAGVEIVVATFKTRAPGMSVNRMPLFVWNVVAVAFAILVAFPALVVGSVLLELDRAFGTLFFAPGEGGSPLLWQHLFWIFGHPEVYIMLLPAVGFVSMIVPTFSQRPIVGYTFVALAAVATAFFSFGLWVHHMFTTGLPWLAFSFFSAASLMIAIPSGVQVFAWIATLWTGRPVFTTSLLFVIGFVFLFVGGGITGVMVAIVPFNWQVHDTHFVVAHFHYVLIGGVVFPIFGALYYWLPKMTGKLMSEPLGWLNFALMFIGFNLVFFPMHFTGLLGMPRRVYTYQSDLGLDTLNLISTIGALVLAVGVAVFIWNFIQSLIAGKPAGNDPWHANTLEWAATSPPQQFNFSQFPAVQSRDPLWDQDDLYETDDELFRPADVAQQTSARREIMITTGLDARPEAISVLPGPTLWPLVASLGLAAMFVGVLVEIYLISAIGGVIMLIGAFGWHWTPVAADASVREDTAIEERRHKRRAGFIPVVPTTAWWGMLTLMISVVSFAGALIFSYFHLWARATEWPPEGMSRPDLLLPIAATVVLVVSAAAVFLADLGSRDNKRGLMLGGLGLSCVLAVAFLVLLAFDYALVDFTPRTNAYGSLYFVVTGFVAVNVVAMVIVALWMLGQAWFGRGHPTRNVPVEVVGIYWYVVTLTWLVIAAVVYLMPYVGATGEQVVI